MSAPMCPKPLYLNELKAKLDKTKPIEERWVQIITHDDMDGYASGAVVYQAITRSKHKIVLPDNIRVYNFNYSDKQAFIDTTADIIFITDYSISNEAFRDELLKAYKSGKYEIFWCDHHQTTFDMCTGKYKELENIPGFRSPKYCAAALAWYFLHPGTTEDSLPRFLKLVDDFDSWKKKIPESDYLNLAFNYYKEESHAFKSCKNPKWGMWIGNITYAQDALEYGKKFNEIIKDYDYANIRNHGWIGKLDKFPKLEFLCLSCDMKGSQLFSDIFKSDENPDGKYPYACAFQYNGSAFSVSIYSSKNAKPNAKEICEAYGGGGHPGAAGFTTKTFFVEKIRDL